MNEPPREYILVDEKRLLAFVQACFEKAGLEKNHAALIARLLVNNDLRGVRSHASRTAHSYCMAFANGHLNPRPQVGPLQQTAATVVLDGDGTLGYLPMVRAAEEAVERARQYGIGLALVRHIGHYGSAGHYTRICMEKGCVGFSVQGYRGEANARGSTNPPLAAFSGNPPISFAIPGKNEADIVLDGGANVFDGAEAADLFERIPGTFFKSMGYIAVSSLLGGALAGITLPAADRIESRWPAARMGGLVGAIDVASLVSDDAFRAEVDRYCRDLRQTHKPMAGTDRIRLPGHIEAERLERHRRDGIRFGQREQDAMRALHEHFQVPLPWS